MRRVVSTLLLALSTVSLLVAAPTSFAAVKKKTGPTPKITRVAPMRLSVGEKLTITGRNFKSKRTANTIIFRAPNGRPAFAKPRRASRTRLVVRVPASVSRLLTVSGNSQQPTRLKLRVLAGKLSKFTSRRLSPVFTGVAGGPDAPKVCKDDADHDDDLLSNELELSVKTDPCLADTDGDQMTDGWEYWAAKDLNIKAVPYPGKRPYTNPLDPSDGGNGSSSGTDFDGDGLTSVEEYRAWRYTGSAFDGSRGGGLDLQSPLGYSDGTKFSRSDETPAVPQWRSANYGLANPPQAFPATYDLQGDPGVWRDSERDADADGLANRLESARGPYANSWWQRYWASFDPAPEPYPETYYGHYTQRPFPNLDIADPDVDGDTLLDGEDDQDNDDYTNIVEMYETEYDLDGDGNPIVDGDGRRYPSILRAGAVGNWIVNAFNPCAPNPDSRTCEDYAPF